MSEPEDFISRAEKSKAFRSLMLGGKFGEAFAKIGGGALVFFTIVSWLIAFTGSPNFGFVLPTVFFLVVVAGFLVHFWRSPILSAPFIMFGFFAAAIGCFGFGIYLYTDAALGDVIINGGVLDVALREHAIQFEKLTKEEDIKAHIERNKANNLKRNAQERNVGNSYTGVSALLMFTAVYGFFSRLWLMENAIIDTQLRLISLSERSQKIAENLKSSIQVTRFSVSDDQNGKFTDLESIADECERGLTELTKGLSDLPYVGFRKGRLLFFKRKQT